MKTPEEIAIAKVITLLDETLSAILPFGLPKSVKGKLHYVAEKIIKISAEYTEQKIKDELNKRK